MTNTVSIKEGYRNRAKFLDVMAQVHDRDEALRICGFTTAWLYRNTGNWMDFKAAYQALQYSRGESAPGINDEGDHSPMWSGGFHDFRNVFLGRESPWFHLLMADQLDKMNPGEIYLVILPPGAGKTGLLEDRSTYELAVKPTTRITLGKEKKEKAEESLSMVRQRFVDDVQQWWKLRERFGPFAPKLGKNSYGQAQVWSNDAFNLFKRRLGDERDYNMQALGMGTSVAGTRCDLLFVDDPQTGKTLSQSDKLMRYLHDDWFPRTFMPEGSGRTMITMNVVGEDDIAERLISEGSFDHLLILPAYNEAWADSTSPEYLGPRGAAGKALPEPSPWLWPEVYTEAAYLQQAKNTGGLQSAGWQRKFMQDWRPAVARTFSDDMWAKCQNELRSINHRPQRHPQGKPAEIAVSLDPMIGRSAVSAAAFEPTRLVMLDSYAEKNLKTIGQIIDLVISEINRFHVPGESVVKWVIVETKGFQKGIITDDAFLALQAEIGFHVVEQTTGWDKRDTDFGVTAMARSMDYGEIDIPAMDIESRERFDGLRVEMRNWRPNVKGSKLEMDEVMAMWFCWTYWHKERRRSIRRGTDASNFGFGGVPLLPGQRVGRPAVDLSKWRFGQPVGR